VRAARHHLLGLPARRVHCLWERRERTAASEADNRRRHREARMKLYFVRHATAARKSTWRKDDDLRPLTRVGRARFRTAAESLVSAGVLAPDRILTSPLVRAVQTAAILDKALAVPRSKKSRFSATISNWATCASCSLKSHA
jgi:hypothetical protein